MTTREDAYPYPGEQYILSVDRYQIEVMDHLDELPPRAPSSSAPSLRSVMVSDTPRAFLRSARGISALRNSFFHNSSPARPPNAPTTYNPSGAPYAGAFYMGR